MRLRGRYIHFEIEKISIFLCQKVTRICVLTSIDVITTNPPFGTQIKDTRKEVLAAYDLGHKIVDGEPTSELLDGQDPDKLFGERDISYLKDATDSSDGGRMVIVLEKDWILITRSGSTGRVVMVTDILLVIH